MPAALEGQTVTLGSHVPDSRAVRAHRPTTTLSIGRWVYGPEGSPHRAWRQPTFWVVSPVELGEPCARAGSLSVARAASRFLLLELICVHLVSRA